MSKKNLFYIPFIILPLIITLALFKYMPNTIPTHYNFSGVVDRWGSKNELFILPILTIVFCGIFIPLMLYSNEKSKKQSLNNTKVITISNIILILVFNVLSYVFLYTAFNGSTKLVVFNGKWSSIAIGLIFLVIGVYMPKTKPNKFIGIRTHATLSNPEVWTKTHHFAGKLFTIFSLIYLLIIILMPYYISNFVLIIGLLIVTIWSSIYANKLSKARKDNTDNKLDI